MSLPVFDPQTHWFGWQAISREVVSETDRYRLSASKIYPLLVQARPKLQACYCLTNGRPGVEAVLLLGVSVLQFLERYVESQLDYKSSAETLKQKVMETGEDVLELRRWLALQPEAWRQGEKVQLLERVWSEQFEVDEAGGGVRNTEMGLGKPSELDVDGAYVSGQALAEAEGCQLLGPALPPAQTGKSAFQSDAVAVEVK